MLLESETFSLVQTILSNEDIMPDTYVHARVSFTDLFGSEKGPMYVPMTVPGIISRTYLRSSRLPVRTPGRPEFALCPHAATILNHARSYIWSITLTPRSRSSGSFCNKHKESTQRYRRPTSLNERYCVIYCCWQGMPLSLDRSK